MKRFEVSPIAEKDLQNIEDYLLEKWTFQVLEDFAEKLQKAIDLILFGDVIFQKFENTEYHKLLITKHNTLIYSFDGEQLKIHRILQNFQDPEENFKPIT